MMEFMMEFTFSIGTFIVVVSRNDCALSSPYRVVSRYMNKALNYIWNEVNEGDSLRLQHRIEMISHLHPRLFIIRF